MLVLKVITVIFSVKPQLPTGGGFEVTYQGNFAILSWPKPTGDYTRQVIEQWTNKNRKKRSTESECRRSPETCKEHPVDKNKTTMAIQVSHHGSTFILVLYDGNVPLTSIRSNTKAQGSYIWSFELRLT